MDIVLTQSEELKKTDYYKTVHSIITRMMDSGVLHLSSKQCVSAADMMYVSLAQWGIKSKLVECQVVVESNKAGVAHQTIIGFNNLSNDDEIDTHIVCITETEIPMIIDTSVIHVLNQFGKAAIVDTAIKDNNRIIYNFSSSNLKITYQSKKEQTIPMAHQISILDRIETDKSVFKQLKFLRWLIIGALVISTTNAIRGGWDAYQVYVVNDNYWGPSAMKHIADRLDNIENKLKK